MSQKNDNELPKQAVENTLNLNPVAGIRGKDLLTSAHVIPLRAMCQPLHSTRHVAHFSLELKSVPLDQPELYPDDDDRRFSDPAWSQDPLYKCYVQTYLVWCKELRSQISHSGLSPQDISRDQFAIDLLTEATSPTNNLSNPAAVKRSSETDGKSLLDSLGHLAKDLVNNGGMPSQVDMDTLEVGRNLVTAEGVVVFRNDVLGLIQYRPIIESAHERLLPMVPSQISKFYVFDPSPDKGLARFCLCDGAQTFIVSWCSPTESQREQDLTIYIEAFEEVIKVVLSITDNKDLNPLGVCSGGITTATLVGHYVANGEKKVNAFIRLVSIFDLELSTQVAPFADEKTLKAARRHSYQSGVLEGKDMTRVFAWMHPDDLIWNCWASNYLLGNQSPALDIPYWNNNITHLPVALHGEFVELFKSNPLNRPGVLEVLDTPIDLKQVTCDFYYIAGLNGHITPQELCYRSARLLDGRCEFIPPNDGHIRNILNPLGNSKAHFMTNLELPVEPKA